MANKKELTPEEQAEMLGKLEARFLNNPQRHATISWAQVLARLEAHQTGLLSLMEMESTGGEPDVVGMDSVTGEFLFVDCTPESPAGRRSLCYDREALDSRKENKPANNVIETAASMGIELLTEQQYRDLQKLGAFDTKTSSWVKTPAEIRRLGGALFCDRRYNQVFLYHNGAESYYAARGFRGLLKI